MQSTNIKEARLLISRFIGSIWFNSFMGILIILNLFYIGIESDFKQSSAACSAESQDESGTTTDESQLNVWVIIDNTFASVFVAEIALRIIAGGIGFFKEFENVVDLGLVVSGSVDVWFLSKSSGGCSSSTTGQSVKILTALRVIRIMRVIRFFRLMKSFGQIRLIVSGLMSSSKTLLWVFVFMMVIIYMCSIFTTTQLGTASDNFSSIPNSMLTLFQITTLDSWSDTIVRPLVSDNPAFILFFLIYIFITSFGLLNIVLGIVVENTVISANDKKMRDMREKEVLKQGAIASLRDLFDYHAMVGAHGISKEDYVMCLKVSQIRERWNILELPESLESVLFPNSSDSISIEDLVSICAQLSMSSSPSGLADLLNDLDGLKTTIKRTAEIAQEVFRTRSMLQERLSIFEARSNYYLTGNSPQPAYYTYSCVHYCCIRRIGFFHA